MPVVGEALLFGVQDDQAGLTTQKFTTTLKTDKKEGKDKGGDVIGVAFYNKTLDVSIDGLTTDIDSLSQDVGTTLAINNLPLDLGTLVYCEEVSVDQSNEDFVKIGMKGMSWESVTQ